MASGVHWAYARGGVLLDIRSSGVSSQAPPRPCSPSTVCAALDIVRPFSRFFMAIDEVKIAKQAARNYTFAKCQRTNKRPSAVSLIQFSLIRYSQLCAVEKYRFQQNSPRLPLPREHPNATTKAYAIPRDWSVHGGDTKSESYKPNSTASRYSQRDGV